MPATRRETSAESAARFLRSALRRRPARSVIRERKCSRCGDPGHYCSTCPQRIHIDFAEPTLRLIHEVLCERVSWAEDVGAKLNLLIIAEQMVGAALGEPPAFDGPPLTDREVR